MRLGRGHWSHSLECFFLRNSFIASVYSWRILGDTLKPQAKQGVTCFPSGCTVHLAASCLTYLFLTFRQQRVKYSYCKMHFLEGMGKDLPLFRSVCARGARHGGVWGSMCGTFHVHVPSLLTFEFKYAGQVKKTSRNPKDSIICLLACVSWMVAWQLAHSGMENYTWSQRQAAPGVVCQAEGEWQGNKCSGQSQDALPLHSGPWWKGVACGLIQSLSSHILSIGGIMIFGKVFPRVLRQTVQSLAVLLESEVVQQNNQSVMQKIK